MSRLPHENRNVVDRPDLPEYELNEFCPVTGESFNLENHHLWPRRYANSYWIELADGSVVGNRVNLSSQAHQRITENRARISYEDGLFWWIENDERTKLRWQPPKWKGDVVYEEDDDAWVFGGHEKFETPNVSIRDEQHPEPGQECSTCKRRVPYPKKESSPKTKVFSTRIPIDDVDTFKELVKATAEHHGLTTKPHFEYWCLLFGLMALLQLEKGELPV